MTKAKELFVSKSYDQVKEAIRGIPDQERGDIYALSFWYQCEDDDVRYPMIVVGYNTHSNWEANIRSASSKEEAKWNFAFWLQNELAEMGGMEDPLLGAWFEASPYYYSEEQHEEATEDDDLFDELLERGAKFADEFREEAIAMAQRLFKEGVVREVFGQDIPILVHELEYYDDPVDWTVRANPEGLVDEFVAWVEEEG